MRDRLDGDLPAVNRQHPGATLAEAGTVVEAVRLRSTGRAESQGTPGTIQRVSWRLSFPRSGRSAAARLLLPLEPVSGVGRDNSLVHQYKERLFLYWGRIEQAFSACPRRRASACGAWSSTGSAGLDRRL